MNKKVMLTRKTWEKMRQHVSHCAPLEACGLLSGNQEQVNGSQGIPNAERSPVRFRMEPHAQWRAFQRMEAAGLEMVGIYHSHPNGPNRPSPTDIAENMYPVTQIIWFREKGQWCARAYNIENKTSVEIPLEIQKCE
jgi:proteasome lid subunit RPN8/RPN11